MAAQAVMRCCGTQAHRLSVLCNQQAPSIIATSRQAIARGCQQRQPRLWLGASQPTARHATVLSASKAESRGAGGNEAKGSGQKQPKREELSGKGSPDPRDAAGKTKAKQDDTEEDGFLDEGKNSCTMVARFARGRTPGIVRLPAMAALDPWLLLNIL